MTIYTHQGIADSQSLGHATEFKIRNSAKAFAILSSGLYQNKIKAIIRELSCNAIDSHTAAGNTEPYLVHLPTSINPEFFIRDFGTGLSEEQVEGIYTTYFESSKSDSNDFIGALGLGSKSPFSYTNSFTVTAIKDGIQAVFNAFINADGVPSITLISKDATIEPNGVMIKFKALPGDYYKFAEEAAQVYKTFEPSKRPKIVGNSNFQFQDNEYVLRDLVPGVHVLKTRYYNRTSYAVMGNRARGPPRARRARRRRRPLPRGRRACRSRAAPCAARRGSRWR